MAIAFAVVELRVIGQPRLHSPAGEGTGSLFPQPRVEGADGPALLDDLVGSGWRIVTDLGTDELPAGLAARAASLGTLISIAPGGIRELDGVLANWFNRHGCRAAIVRPDHYVFGVAGSANGLLNLLAGLEHRLAA